MARALPQPGEIIADKYVVSSLLGRGGMGAVYVVEHRVTGKRLAVKCLLPEHSEHPELVERFLREAQAAGRIQHRYVVDVFDVGRDGDLLYIVMELIDGKQLGDLLRDATLTAQDILLILLRAMEGVAAAHAEGIVHRDLKPENILVCRGPTGKFDEPRVLDFGISKLEEDASRPLTKSGMMMGTPYYMSFEQINSQRDLDQRVDVYAMGVILYEALSGRVPYQAESVGALAIRMMSGPPESLSQLRPDLSPALVEVVMRTIARERDERFPTMQALIDALSEFVEPELSLTPAGGSAAMKSARASLPRENDRLPGSLRLNLADAQTLRATPMRPEGQLRVDADDESARPSTGAHEFSVAKLVSAALGALIIIVTVVVFWRRGAAHVTEGARTSAARAPIESTQPGARGPAPKGPVPASAEPLKHIDSPEEPEARTDDAAVLPAEEAAQDALRAEPATPEEDEAPARGRKGVRKAKRPKRPALTLEQMVPKAPALPEEEREAEPGSAEPAKVAEPVPNPPVQAAEPPPAETAAPVEAEPVQ